jgi:hypothetical protein
MLYVTTEHRTGSWLAEAFAAEVAKAPPLKRFAQKFREAIAVGAGGAGGGAHTLQEWFDTTGRELGLQRILLIVLALAGTVK